MDPFNTKVPFQVYTISYAVSSKRFSINNDSTLRAKVLRFNELRFEVVALDTEDCASIDTSESTKSII